MSYDPKSLALAIAFLSDCKPPYSTDEGLADKLAQRIQDEIEVFIELHVPESERS